MKYYLIVLMIICQSCNSKKEKSSEIETESVPIVQEGSQLSQFEYESGMIHIRRSFSINHDLVDNGMHLTVFDHRMLVSVTVKSETEPSQYGMVFEYSLENETIEFVNGYDFDKKCKYIGGVTSNQDGSLVAIICQGFTNSYSASDGGGDPKIRPGELTGIFESAEFFNLLAVRGAKGFYVGDIFTFTEPGNDVLIFEFVGGVKPVPDRMVLVNSAADGQTYGQNNILLKDRKGTGDSYLYYISTKNRSNPDARGTVHSDMKEIGLQRNGNGTYSRLRLTDNWGTGLGVTHPNFAQLVYNDEAERWGRLSFGDNKVSFATIPNYLTRNKGNQNPEENWYVESFLEGISSRGPLSLVSLGEDGFLLLVKSADGVVVKKLSQTGQAISETVLEGVSDRGVGKLSRFSVNSESGAEYILGWSSDEGSYKIQKINGGMELVGDPVTLEADVRWGIGNWAVSENTGCVLMAVRSDEKNLAFSALCPTP